MHREFLLIGDSHAHALLMAARQAKYPHRGGTVGSGVSLAVDFCRAIDGDFIFCRAEHQAKQEQYRDLLRFQGPIIATVGFNTHHFANQFAYFLKERKLTFNHISRDLFTSCVLNARSGAIGFYALLREFGCETYFVSSPQRFSSVNHTIYWAFEQVLIDHLEKLGARHIDVRDEVANEYGLLDEFKRVDDVVHGNMAYGLKVIHRFMAMTQ